MPEILFTTRRFLLAVAFGAIALICFQTQLQGQCLVAPPTSVLGGSFSNPDSIRVDSCSATIDIYARNTFQLLLTSSPLSVGATPDSNGFYDIMDFDSNLVDFNVWDSLADANGGITIRRSFPNNTDTASLASRTYELNFGDYVKTAAITIRLGSTSICERATYRNRCISLLELPNEPGLVPRSGISNAGAIVTSGDFPTRRQHELGLLQGYYEVDLPMAWEITKGNNGVYAGVSDEFKSPQHPAQPHTDLTYYNVSTNGEYGNFYHQTGPHSGNVVLHNLYVETTGEAPGHGYHILNQIAAEQNNQGLIGVAPKVRVLATYHGEDYSGLDLLPAAGIQVPHVMNCSFHGFGSWGTNEGEDVNNVGAFYKSMSSGVVMVGTLDNVRDAKDSYTDAFGGEVVFGTVSYGSPTSTVYEKYMVVPKIDSPGANVYRDPVNPSDPSKDVRVLCVLGYDRNVTSSLGACKSPFTQEMRFPKEANFSLGINKFSTQSSIDTRMLEKNAAAVDVLAPRNLVRATYEDGTSKYIDGNTGNSFAIPHVTGIVALMMSVHDRLGLTGFDVQRRVYDIVTFTADKIQDPGLNRSIADVLDITSLEVGRAQLATVPDGPPPTTNTKTVMLYDIPNPMFEGKYPQLLKTVNGERYLATELRAMPNDPLSRYWGIRVGFGRVNAFRCLAHSIPGKNAANEVNVKYQYSGTDVLDWSRGHSLEGKTFLHLGKFKNATELVLDKGGNVYAGEPDYRNNNGKTIVDKDLTVGANQALVIDGILTTELTSNFKKISTTSSSARILATGWIENVTLDGQIRATDIRIKRTIAGDAIRTTNSSELYDTTWVSGSGDFVVASGTLTMQPGSVIYLDGDAKLIVKPGAELKMAYGAKIVDRRTTKTTPCVRLEAKTSILAGGKLTVMPQTEGAVIDAEVQVNNDAEFSVGGVDATFSYEKAIPSVSVRKVTVEVGGKFTVVDKSHVQAVSGVTSTILVLKSESGLTVPAGSTVRLDIPVEVQSGSKIEVKSSALAQIGAITVQSNGSLIVKAGGTLQFLAETNTVRGKLIGEGVPTNKAVFKATNEESNCSGQPARVSYARLYVEPDVWIYNTTTPGTTALDQVLKSYVHLQHAELTNVFTQITNTPILHSNGGVLSARTIKNCDFKADRGDFDGTNLETPFIDKNLYLLAVKADNIAFAKLRAAAPSMSNAVYLQAQILRGDLRVELCSFRDIDGIATKTGSHREGSRADFYQASGLLTTQISRTDVVDCKFAFLVAGMNIVRGNAVNNILGGHADGIILDEGGSACNNKVSGAINAIRCGAGSYKVRDNDLGGTMNTSVNSLFPSGQSVEWIGSGVFHTLASTVEARNNHLEKYGTGLHSVTGVMDVGDSRIWLGYPISSRGDVLINGRNEFIGSESFTGSPYAKPEETSDVFIGESGVVEMKCGRNVLSAAQDFQLQKSEGNRNVVVSNNNFGCDVVGEIRKSNVTPTGTNLRNGEYPIAKVCSTSYKVPDEVECAGIAITAGNQTALFNENFPYMDINAANVAGIRIVVDDWNDLDPGFVEDIYEVSSYWMSNNNIDDRSRVTAVTNAIRSAEIHPNATSICSVLLNDLHDIGLDTNEPVVLREAVVIGRAQMLARREQFRDAHQWLDTARTGLFVGFDSVLVGLSSLRYEVLADTSMTSTQRADTLNALYALEVEHAMRPEPMAKKRLGQPFVHTGTMPLEFSLYPNPNSGRFVVRNEGQGIESGSLSIADNLGAVHYEIHDLSIGRGQDFDISNVSLPTGAYFVTIRSGLSSISVPLSILR